MGGWIKILKELLNSAKRFRSGFLKNYHSDYETVEEDGSQISKPVSFLNEDNSSKGDYRSKLLQGFKIFIDFITSPNISRILYLVGAVAGIALAPPVIFPFAIASAILVTTTIFYKIGHEAYHYRKLDQLKHERAILEELTLLKIQNKVIAQHITKNLNVHDKNDFYDKAGLKQSYKRSFNWKKQNRKKVVALSILAQIPESILPLTTYALTLNWVGFGLSLAGNFFETCANFSSGKAYQIEKERLINLNIGLAEQLGIYDLQNGASNHDLTGRLSDSRALQSHLKKINDDITNGIIPASEATTMLNKYCKERLNDKDSNEIKYKDLSFLQAIKKTIITNGYSYANSFNDFNPMTNTYRNKYSTDIKMTNKQSNKPTKQNTSTSELSMETPLPTPIKSDIKSNTYTELHTKLTKERPFKNESSLDLARFLLSCGADKQDVDRCLSKVSSSLIHKQKRRGKLSSIDLKILKTILKSDSPKINTTEKNMSPTA